MENKDTFLARVTKHLSPEDAAWAELGYIISKHAHRHGRRKKEKGPDGLPVREFEHPRRAATQVLLDIAGCYDRDALIITFLHDTLEDTRVVTPFKLRVWFGPVVERAVVLLTKNPELINEHEYYAILFESRDWRAILAKMCDRTDNLRTLGSDIKFQQKQVRETRNKIFPLMDLLLEIVPEEGLSGVKALYKEMLTLVDNYEKGWS